MPLAVPPASVRSQGGPRVWFIAGASDFPTASVGSIPLTRSTSNTGRPLIRKRKSQPKPVGFFVVWSIFGQSLVERYRCTSRVIQPSPVRARQSLSTRTEIFRQPSAMMAGVPAEKGRSVLVEALISHPPGRRAKKRSAASVARSATRRQAAGARLFPSPFAEEGARRAGEGMASLPALASLQRSQGEQA